MSTTAQRPFVHVPDTVSPEAQAFLRTLRDPALTPAFPDPQDLAGWETVRAFAEADGKAKSAPFLQRYEHTVTEARLGGVPVLDVRPKGWKDDGKVAVYTHGGAHVMYSAASSIGRAVVFADATALRVISVDYTVAPLAKYNQMSDEVIAVIGALTKSGQRLRDTVIYGDSSGGGLAAATVLKLRDRGCRPAPSWSRHGWMSPRAATRRPRCTTPTPISSTKSTASKRRARSPIPWTRRTSMRHRSTATFPEASRRRSSRAA